EVVGMFLLKSVAFDLVPARGLESFVFPDQRIDHVGTEQIGAVNDDTVGVSAHRAPDRGEDACLGGRKLEAGRNEAPAHALLEIVPALKPLAVLGREFRSAPPLVLNAAQALVPKD